MHPLDRTVPDPDWTLETTMGGLHYRDDTLKATLHILTEKIGEWEWGEQESVFCLDGDQGEYGTEAEMLCAIRLSEREMWLDGHWVGTTRRE